MLSIATASRATSLPAGFVETRVAYNLSFPTAIAFAPDGTAFVCEKGGSLRVIDPSGNLQPTPFLTVTTDTIEERGLNGVAVDPNFSTNHYIYIYYTATTPTTHNRVSRFVANGYTAVPGSETPIIDLDDLRSSGSLYGSHNGGALHFDASGHLFIAVGDNGLSVNAQDLTNVKGKVLRINKDGSIPTDNPFYGTTTGNNRAIWVYGLRNPFTFDIQAGTGRIFINDVGLASWEEINDGIAGSNYGWPNTEGYTSDPAFRSPVFAYAHGTDTSTGCAITGGTFYNPITPQFPSAYVGKYFYIDYCNHWIRYLDTSSYSSTLFATNLDVANTVGLTLAPNGSLYYLTVADPAGIGAVYQISYTGSLAPSIGTQPASQIVSVGYPATLSVSASGYDPLNYQWQLNQADIQGANSPTYTTAPVTLADSGAQYRCIVTNGFGTATSNPATITVTTNQPPVPTILTPSSSLTYNAGDTISFSGSATDPQDGPLPPSAFSWRVDFQHNTHFHPFIPWTSGITSGTFTIPTVGETSTNTWYRIYLSVTDSVGLTQTTYVDIHPNVATLTIATNIPNLLATLDGGVLVAPIVTPSVVGFTRSIGVISPQTLNGNKYQFAYWSDGGLPTHNITTPASNTTYTANFVLFRTATLTANPNPIPVWDGSGTGATTVSWTSTNTTSTELHIGAPDGPLLAAGGSSGSATTGKWVTINTVFYLQDRSNGLPLTAANTIATLRPQLTSQGQQGLSGAISASPNPITITDGSGLGITTINWSSTGAVAVEVHVGSPSGPIFAASTGAGSQTTGKWAMEGTAFYLQDVSGGLSLIPANTLAAVTVHTVAGTPTGTLTPTLNPVRCSDGTGNVATTLTWTTSSVGSVEIHSGSPSGPIVTSGGTSGTFTTTKTVTNGTTFYLQNVTGGLPLTSANTLASVQMHVVTSSGSLTAAPNPVIIGDSSGQAAATLLWTSTGTTQVEVHQGSPTGALTSATGTGSQATTTTKTITNGTVFYLQDVTSGLPLTAANTLGTVTLGVTTNANKYATLSATPNPIVVTDGTGLGVATISWTEVGLKQFEIHVNSPNGTLFARPSKSTGSQVTGKWVKDGTVFYLQDVSNGQKPSAANTMATICVNVH